MYLVYEHVIFFFLIRLGYPDLGPTSPQGAMTFLPDARPGKSRCGPSLYTLKVDFRDMATLPVDPPLRHADGTPEGGTERTKTLSPQGQQANNKCHQLPLKFEPSMLLLSF